MSLFMMQFTSNSMNRDKIPTPSKSQAAITYLSSQIARSPSQLNNALSKEIRWVGKYRRMLSNKKEILSFYERKSIKKESAMKCSKNKTSWNKTVKLKISKSWLHILFRFLHRSKREKIETQIFKKILSLDKFYRSKFTAKTAKRPHSNK